MESLIWYAGKEMQYVRTISDIDNAQAELDYYRRLGYASCCTHSGDDHHVYVERRYFKTQ